MEPNKPNEVQDATTYPTSIYRTASEAHSLNVLNDEETYALIPKLLQDKTRVENQIKNLHTHTTITETEIKMLPFSPDLIQGGRHFNIILLI